GAVFRTPPRFIKRQKNQLPEVADAAKSRSDIGEKARLKRKQEERAQFFNNSVDPQRTNERVAKLPADLNLPDEPDLDAPVAEKTGDNLTNEAGKAKNLFSNELMPNVENGSSTVAPSQAEKIVEDPKSVTP